MCQNYYIPSVLRGVQVSIQVQVRVTSISDPNRLTVIFFSTFELFNIYIN